MKITKCTGEGQGSCKRCSDKDKWNSMWMCFLYKIEGYEGCYCADCVKEIQDHQTRKKVLTMREILFRGKTEKGEWVYGDLLHPGLYGNGYSIEDFTKGKNNCFDVIPETVGQYTGLTDKNGKRIFEGDVVRYIAQKSGRTILYGVEWQEEMSRFEMKTINDGIKIHEWLERSKANYCYEVIGNIHDNPELLKGGE